MRIVLAYPVEARHRQQIGTVVRDAESTLASDAEVIDAGQDRLADEIVGADVLCGHVKVPVPWEAVVEAGRLRWIQSSAAGTDHCLPPAIVASDVVVTSASGVLSDQVAEHTLALASAWFRGLPTFLAAQGRREYVRRPTRDLHRATLGIVGFGGVGRRVAELFAPLKMRIVATDLFPGEPSPHVEAVWPADRIDDLLAAADVVVLSAPLTDTTHGLIHVASLRRMKRSALLVNVARGGLVVDDDLAAALHEGTIAGAALDVASVEPLGDNSPLWEAPNLIITPHVAGQSARRADDMTNFFCENLGRYLHGQPLVNRVDKHLGFPRPENRADGMTKAPHIEPK